LFNPNAIIFKFTGGQQVNNAQNQHPILTHLHPLFVDKSDYLVVRSIIFQKI